MNPTFDPSTIITDLENQPWYQSSQGPKVSMTLKSMAGLLLPLLDLVFKVQIGTEALNRWIDIILIAVFGGLALYGYIRSRKAAAAQVGSLRRQLALAKQK